MAETETEAAADPRRVLGDGEVHTAKPPGWEVSAGHLWREVAFGAYRAGVDFALRVAELAEAQDHHPELLLAYRRVRVSYHSHDVGGLTARDLRAAHSVNALLEEVP